MGIFDRFTEGARRTMSYAQESAKQLGRNYVGSEDLLIGLLRVSDSVAAKALARFGVMESDAFERASAITNKGDYQFTDTFGYNPHTKKILELSLYEAKMMKTSYIGTEHILLAIISEQGCTAAKILIELGVDLNALRKSIVQSIGGDMPASVSSAAPETSSTPTLDQYSKDITAAARSGELDPVIGRHDEIQRIIQILSRRSKNNPVLIGDPGVGKSAIIEGLAQSIVNNEIPDLLRNKRVVSLDLGQMLAGTKFRGEFEERIKSTINELKGGDTILFIDELHTIVGAGATEGSVDASNILKPALARGEIQVVGATTPDEYRKYIEKDAALERRFQPVNVGEPTEEETYAILCGLRDRYEAHHKVHITDEALHAAVSLSDRYITDRFLPDKAIDLMDEAASRVRLSGYVAPPDVKELESKLESLLKEKEEAVNNQNYERAAAVRDEEQKLRGEISTIRDAWEQHRNTKDSTVSEEDIAQVVNAWTGIPVKQLTEDESEKLLRLEATLHERVIGQDEAVSAVSRAIRRARAGLKDPRRPIGSYLFLGPTGVGKTELSKALAEAMFSDEDAMIRLDMSEYMESHSVSRLIGSPPGYVGYDDGGQLTKSIRRKPYSVVLLDEIEKAHPDVFNILLQVLEDGRLTDAHGRTVDFRNCIIIMTSNLGASKITSDKTMGFAATDRSVVSYERMKEVMMSELKKAFRPEFLNRIDEIIIFHPLEAEQTMEIVKLMLRDVTDRLRERNIELIVTHEAAVHLASDGFDPQFGARPLRRAIQNQLEDNLSEVILSGEIRFGDKVEAYAEDGQLKFRKVD